MKKILFLLGCLSFSGIQVYHAFFKRVGLHTFLSERWEEIGYDREEIGGKLDVERMKVVLDNLLKMGMKFVDSRETESVMNILNILDFPNEVLQTEGDYETYLDKYAPQKPYKEFHKEVRLYSRSRGSNLIEYATEKDLDLNEKELTHFAKKTTL